MSQDITPKTDASYKKRWWEHHGMAVFVNTELTGFILVSERY